MSTGGSTTITENNNPYTNALAKNAQSSFGVMWPTIQARMQGLQTPFDDVTTASSANIARHFAGRYGQQPGDPNLESNMMRMRERLTMPDMSALQTMGSMYGAGQPSGGGTTSTTQQNMGTMDYLQLAATIAALTKV